MQRLSKRYIIPFLFIFAGYTAAAQEKVDSLRSAFIAESDDSLKCLTLDRMLFFMRSQEMVDSALHYGQVLKALAKSAGLRYFQARGHIAIGLAYDKLENTDSVIWNYHRAAALCRPGADDFTKASVLNSIGVTYQKIDLYDSAYAYYLQTMTLLETLDLPNYVARTKNNIGNVFWLRGDHEKALEYYKAGLADERHLNDSVGMSNALTNVANAYNKLGDPDSALLFMNEAISLYRNQNNKVGEALALADMSFIYTDKGEYDKALVTARQSLALSEETGDSEHAALSLQSIGEIQIKLKNYNQAIATLKQGLEITDRLSLRYIASNIHEELIDAYKGKENYRLALKHAELLRSITDTIFNEDKSKLVAEYEARYESEKKNKELAVLYKDNELQESQLREKVLQQYALIGGSAFLAVAGLAFFRVYRSKQEQKRKLLDQQLTYEKIEAERLQELDESKSRFFANIAHEFRTPLTLIQVPAEMIWEESNDPGAKDNAQLILDNASRLLTLTNRLLDLTKLEAGMVKLQPVKIDFITFSKGCIHSFESLAEENDIRLTFESEDDALSGDIDPEKCAIILNNLVSNALKFTEPFGHVGVKIAHSPQDPSVISVTVQDSGIGIDENLLPYIFDRFYQADDSLSRRTSGTGIG
ncbi:MAG: tetratricopeptide repeat-containing sensor histidine kinase, partial [Bacteroidota bacterium]|nr:tetratricopeptide repeat-containing sensor histidine kinase [Bacteroidota bacterium]